ncbi:hsp90 co-chaperone Cdc37-like protein 1 [Sarcoptes scabiei]|uniref:Hsp90 co-chaperone Cdc37 n=1 Tax=Sarcoptes scabiei TaxID=52283 RepID=A0A132AH47_SARSC|nr:hsp90 co-chaperone Cdc37-like protein 1 [Sarcoptes scabiei]
MVDYSKWKNIEISDDEDDTHPNIDTASLFRWRHQARVERMEGQRKEKEEFEMKKKENEKKMKELAKKKESAENPSAIDEQLKKLELEKKELESKEQELIKAEKLQPWNVDTISKDGWSKTIINKQKPMIDRSKMTDEELEQHYKEFVNKYESKIKEYAMISRFEDAKQFLNQNSDLVCEDTSNYLTFWCLNLEIEGKHDLMEYVAKQVTSLHFILELSKQIKIDPRACVSKFFDRIQQAEQTYLNAFEDELSAFKQRVCTRAKQKIQEVMKECEEEERQKRLGPGGLDPQEVFESLPEELQKCFESRDIELLQKTILEMDPQVVRHHMKRCVDSGLWIPDKSLVDTSDDETNLSEKQTEDQDVEQKVEENQDNHHIV